MIHEVVALYLLGEPVTFEINVTKNFMKWHVLGDTEWKTMPWNEVFADLEACQETDITSAAMRKAMNRGKRK